MDAEKEISKINDEIMDTEMKRRQHMHKLKLEQAKAAYQKRMASPEYRASISSVSPVRSVKRKIVLRMLIYAKI